MGLGWRVMGLGFRVQALEGVVGFSGFRASEGLGLSGTSRSCRTSCINSSIQIFIVCQLL